METIRQRPFVLLATLLVTIAVCWAAGHRLPAQQPPGETYDKRPLQEPPKTQQSLTPSTAEVIGPITRKVIAGGGGTSTGGNFRVDGTIGEVSAANTQSGATFTLNGGYWSTFQDAVATPTPSPTATPTPTPTPTPPPGPPTIFVETGTVNQAVALDSVTFVRGPFRVLNDHNFSADHHTRIILLTTNLGLTQPDPAQLTVQAAGFTLLVENVGPVTGVSGLDASYIVVRLPDGLPPGDLPLLITLRGVSSNNSPTISISP